MRFTDTAEELALRRAAARVLLDLRPGRRAARALSAPGDERAVLPRRRSASSARTAGSASAGPRSTAARAARRSSSTSSSTRSSAPACRSRSSRSTPSGRRSCASAPTEQKATYLPGILAGEINVAIGYTEPTAGTDLASLRTTARLDGDEWVINGSKVFTSGANQADFIWLACRTEPDAAEARRACRSSWCRRRLARLPLDADRHRRRHRHHHDVLRRRPRPRRQHRRRARRRLADDHHPAQPRARRTCRARRPGLAAVGRGPRVGAREQPSPGGTRRRSSTCRGCGPTSPTATPDSRR